MKVYLELDRCTSIPQDCLAASFPPWNNMRDFFLEREGLHIEKRKKEKGGQSDNKPCECWDTCPQPSSSSWLKIKASGWSLQVEDRKVLSGESVSSKRTDPKILQREPRQLYIAAPSWQLWPHTQSFSQILCARLLNRNTQSRIINNSKKACNIQVRAQRETRIKKKTWKKQSCLHWTDRERWEENFHKTTILISSLIFHI